MKKITWKKQIHPGYHPEIYKRLDIKNPIGKWQYKGFVDGESKYSIVTPSLATFGTYEAYCGETTPRFGTLKEAKQYCEDNSSF